MWTWVFFREMVCTFNQAIKKLGNQFNPHISGT